MWASGAFGYPLDYFLWWVVLASLILHTWCFFKFFPRDRLRRFRLVAGNVLMTLCLLGAAGVIAETYFRFLVVETDSYGVSLVSKRWFKLYPKLNSLYFRDKEWAEVKPASVRRIAFVGDSFTYGWGINNVEDRFTEILQRRFDEKGGKAAEVMNAAWVGWDTEQERRAIHDLIEFYHVDEVVLCYVPNDIDTLLPVSDEVNPREPPKSRFINTESSFLFDYLFHRLWARRTPSVRSYCDWLADGYASPEIWNRQTRILDDLIRFCRDRDVTLRAALLPFLRVWGERFDAGRIHRQLAEFFTARGVPVVDLLPTLAGHDPTALMVNDYDPHPNELANRLFAEAMWKTFWMDSPGP